MKFDEILTYLGAFGPYQKRVYFLVCFMAITCAFNQVGQVFLAANTDHWCKTPQLERQDCSSWNLDTETCNELKYNATIPEDNEDTILRENNCRRCDVTYSEFGEDTERCKLSDPDIKECVYGWEYDRSQYKNTVVQEFDLVCEDGKKASLAQSIYFVGVLLGSLVFGALADIIGRKITLFICITLAFCFGIATIFSPGYWWFTILRALVGFSNMGVFLIAFIIGTELVGPSKRTFAGIVIEFYFAGGYMILALLAYLIRDWKYLQLAMTLPMLLYFFMIPFIPESVRWLISKNRLEEAEEIIRACALRNKVDNLPKDLFEEERNKKKEDESTEVYTMIDLFKTPNMRMKTINLLYNWMVNSLVYYGLSLSAADIGGRDYLAFFLSGAVEIPAYLSCLFAIDRWGRRPVICFYMVLGGIACFGTIWIPDGVWRTTVSLIGKFGIAASFAIIYIFAAELYPTPVRSVGMGLSSMTARIGGILAPFILEAGKLWEPLPLIIFSLMSISAGLLALLLPETLNKDLPETMEEGEQFGK
ncbi:organic cation transporter protein-like [Antedon mediterranea]|uniref:organic cation transporter protein-like n=1 Tax=Antedon mediterranea TaxID=105859 RepID=UPI003AF57833